MDPSDEELMVRVQAGDHEAYGRLFARWREPLFSFLVRRTGGRAEAEEAFSETWLRVFRSSATWNRARPFRPWLYAIAANAGRDTRRPEPAHFDLAPVGDEPADLRDRVVEALAKLDPGDRRLLLLAAEGFEGPEIAAMLDIGAGAVRMRLHRARERMRAALGTSDA
jgi:RNA polymerase sigma-70 factor (ECF subfamily)